MLQFYQTPQLLPPTYHRPTVYGRTLQQTNRVEYEEYMPYLLITVDNKNRI